jgi:hypothetical protein
VCSAFRPDDRHRAAKLIASLEAIDAPHDIVETPRVSDSREANTMAKPTQIFAAMDRHPTKTIVFLDVGCEVLGSLEQLSRITGDVGFYVCSTFRRSGGMCFGARSGTIVLRACLGSS